MTDQMTLDQIDRDDIKYVSCPFCGEDDFDLYGLKHHFLMGWCDVFNDTEREPHAALVTQKD